MTKIAHPMNDNEPLAIGDRVQLRRFPHVQGYVWSMDSIVLPGTVIVEWDDPEESAQVHPRHLAKITLSKRKAVPIPQRYWIESTNPGD